MRYEGAIYRPPSEAHSYILQATIGCSWNHCTYCDMYRAKKFRVRTLDETLTDLEAAAARYGDNIRKVFVVDGDALAMEMDHWEAILERCRELFAKPPRVSCYATARNINEKTADELARLRELGLSLLYIGPESGDDATLKRLAKGATAEEHARAAQAAHDAGMQLSAIFLLGAGGVERSKEHAEGTADLVTQMSPEFVSFLTLTVLENTPMGKLEERGDFVLPSVADMLGELRTIVALAKPRDALFRTNHASNYLPLAGRLPADKDRIVATIDSALSGKVALRPEWLRGL